MWFIVAVAVLGIALLASACLPQLFPAVEINGETAWFKKWHFQVTPEIDRTLRVKGFLILGVTLI